MQKTINQFGFIDEQGRNSKKSLVLAQIYSHLVSKIDRRALKFSPQRNIGLHLKINLGRFLPQAPQLVPIRILPHTNLVKTTFDKIPP